MKSALEQQIKKRLQERGSGVKVKREKAIKLLENGEIAPIFLEAIKNHGKNEKGEDLILSPYLVEALTLISDMRVPLTLVSGAAQTGKTLVHLLLICYLSQEGKLNTLWAYPQERILNKCVPFQFRPIMESWLKSQGINPNKVGGSKNNTLYQLDGGANLFTYVMAGAVAKTGGATAAASVVAISADLLVEEERSQYPIGAGAPLARRLDAGRLRYHPIRQLGTPGSGKGIEEEINKATHVFTPHIHCNSCHKLIELMPQNTLFLETTIKTVLKEKKTFFSYSGRPLKWRYKEEEDPIGSAYFGCPKCGAELTATQREKGLFYERNSKQPLVNLLKSDLEKIPNLSIALIFSPLLRKTATNLAAEMVKEGLETSKPDDWQQQRLGIPSEIERNNISEQAIELAFKKPLVDRKNRKVFRIAGLDQGRSEHWLCVIDYILPLKWRGKSNAQLIEESDRELILACPTDEIKLAAQLKELNVEFGLIDNEPKRELAYRFPPLEIGDERASLKHDFVKDEVREGGVGYPCWLLYQPKYLGAVHSAFMNVRGGEFASIRLPPILERYRTDRSEVSPIRHFRSVSYNAESESWERPADRVDHLYHAFGFCEAAFEIWIVENVYDFSWMKML